MRTSLALLALLLLGACGRGPDVVIYCALDEEYARPVLAEFEARTGLTVEAAFDVEANKSVGLRRRLQQEGSRPICDVFWNNEVVQTVVLAQGGLLQPYRSPSADGIDDEWRDEDDRWCGFAARGRILIVNTQKRAEDRRPRGLVDFLDPANAGQCAMAEPLTGTTAAHAGAWLAQLGLPATLERFEALRANRVTFAGGNAHVMRLVRDGQQDFGWTDTDDCQSAIAAGYPVVMVVPDQGPDDDGLVLIPNTVALVAGAPHPEIGKRLIDFLLSPDVEALLAAGGSAQIPLHPGVARPAHVLDPGKLHVAEIDWEAAGEAYEQHAEALEAAFRN